MEETNNSKIETLDSYKGSLCKMKKDAYDDLYDLAEIESGELYDEDNECDEVEYMLEKILKDGTYYDAVHGIHHFIDYIHAVRELEYI